jgi:ribosomal protein S18 acetylase RimI-like enzyme
MGRVGGDSGFWADSTGILLVQAVDAGDLDAVRLLIREYAAVLKVDLCFQQLDEELDGLPWEYAPPRGSLLLATVYGELAGCCALRPLDGVDYADACEMKRLYVRPQYRGMGLGRRLVESMLDQARQADYACVLLDTLSDMEAARALYDDLGFKAIPPYYYNPIAGAHYFKAEL